MPKVLGLMQASFKGVQFEVESANLTVGRRVQVFEYPQRDEPFTEDLGKSARRITFDAFVGGETYIYKMRALINAMESSGAGTLIHPWLGTMRVIAETGSEPKFDKAAKIASISLKFVEVGKQQYPSGSSILSSLCGSAADKLKEVAKSVFGDSLTDVVKDVQDFVKTNIGENLSSMLGSDDLKKFTDNFPGLTEDVEKIAATAVSVLANPRDGVSIIADLIGVGGYSDYVAAWSRIASMASTVVNSHAVSGNSSRIALSYSTREKIDQGTSICAALIRTVMISNMVGAVSNVGTEYDRIDTTASIRTACYDDLIQTRTLALNTIDSQMLLTTDDSVYSALEDARVAVYETLTERAESSARLVDFTPQYIEPALVLAYDFYDDASRDSEIIERNNIRHGGFVAPSPLKMLLT